MSKYGTKKGGWHRGVKEQYEISWNVPPHEFCPDGVEAQHVTTLEDAIAFVKSLGPVAGVRVRKQIVQGNSLQYADEPDIEVI